MPKLKPETLEARREHILDAAELCFAESGFHRCTMADICSQAGISAGALYVHFESKEALIAGIVERDRAKLSQQFAELSHAADLAAAITGLGEYYAVEQPHHKRVLHLEIAAESTRNERISEICKDCDQQVMDGLADLIERAQADGRVSPSTDPHRTAQMICVIGEGLFWRRAVDPEFDAQALMPTVMQAIAAMLSPTSATPPDAVGGSAKEPALEDVS